MNRLPATEPSAGKGPLDGVRILDLTSTMSGPFCTLLLAQLGASVDKIEPPTGDVVRHLTAGKTPGMSPIYLALNGGKRSVVLDLRQEEGRAILARALPHYDVVVHNMRASAAARLGLSREGLDGAGSKALLCELVGYGPGPYENVPAYDDTIQAAAGVAWVQGRGGTPEYVRNAVADKISGMYAALGISAALAGHRAGNGPSQVRIPMFEALVGFTAAEQWGGLTYEPATGPSLYPRTASRQRRPFATSDGYISLMLYTDKHWKAFLEFTGHHDLVEDPRFVNVSARTNNIDHVYGVAAQELAARTTDEWLAVFGEIDVPHAKVNSLDDLLVDEHVTAVDLFAVQDHPTEGKIRTVRSPFLIDGAPLAALEPAPALGAHTQDFVDEFGS
ncbi:CoA transferase [Streptomyces sp. NPDC050625]|uniref:CaiB/BaiF CoA transferase family protein n=1 Tax=Streptomyces sp. NPDC050625 TaxID=3154629 RepID=UPI00341F716D